MSCKCCKCLFILTMYLMWVELQHSLYHRDHIKQNWGFKVRKTIPLLFDKHIQYILSKSMCLPKPHMEYSGKCWHDGSMMKWGEIRSCERQNPTVSYEQLLSDLGGPTQSWFIDTCTRCSRARTSCSKGGRICWGKCSQEKKLHHCWHMRRCCDSRSPCVGVTSPVRTL